jgi:hypothetical protein
VLCLWVGNIIATRITPNLNREVAPTVFLRLTGFRLHPRKTWTTLQSGPRPRAIEVILAGAFAWVLAWQLITAASGYRQVIRDFNSKIPALGGSDFPAFYMGAKLFASTDRRLSYDDKTQAKTILAIKGYGEDLGQDSGWFRYYNPPAYSLLLAPLTLLPLKPAYLLTIALNIVAFLGLVMLVGSILRWRQPLTGLVLLAIAGSQPLLYSFWHAQPNIVLALIVGSAFLLAERSETTAGAILASGFIKPQWLLFSAPALCRKHPRSAVSFAAVLLVMLVPFVAVGREGVLDYILLVRHRGYEDVHDAGFAEALLSWSGFLRAYSGAARPDAWAAFSILTALAFAPIWVTGKTALLPLAAVLTTLLIGPHSHPQDWLLIAPPACFILRDQKGLRLCVTAVLLMTIDVAVNGWSGLAYGEQAFYWPTLAAFATLVWIWVLALNADRRLWQLLSRRLPGPFQGHFLPGSAGPQATSRRLRPLGPTGPVGIVRMTCPKGPVGPASRDRRAHETGLPGP